MLSLRPAEHNTVRNAGRAKAIGEAARVLRPGGRLVLADIWATRRHVRQRRELGWRDVTGATSAGARGGARGWAPTW